MGPFLLSEEFGEMLLCRPLQLVDPVDVVCVAVLVDVPVLLLCLLRSLRPVMPVVLVVSWSVGGDTAVCIIESFMAGSY